MVADNRSKFDFELESALCEPTFINMIMRGGLGSGTGWANVGLY